MIIISAPGKPIRISLHISGSKSISNRLLILNYVLGWHRAIKNCSDSNDTEVLKSLLKKIKPGKSAKLDAEDAGTVMRFMTALLSVTPGLWEITGTRRMKQRPIGDLVTALKQVGADIKYLGMKNCPPLLIRGKKPNGPDKIKIRGDVSSQFISAMLLISPCFDKGISLHIESNLVSRPYLKMTIAMLRASGMKIKFEKRSIRVSPPPKRISVNNFIVESDWSSASYWYSVCALNKGSEIKLSAFSKNSLQADSILPGLYLNLGVKTRFEKKQLVLTNTGKRKKTFKYDFTHCPDIAQTLAVTCFALKIPAVLTGLITLKIKETDRILALKNELNNLGAKVNLSENTLRVFPSGNPLPGYPKIKTYGDHRMAMSFAPLALVYKQVRIENPDLVNKSYPRFWLDLKKAGFDLHLRP